MNMFKKIGCVVTIALQNSIKNKSFQKSAVKTLALGSQKMFSTQSGTDRDSDFVFRQVRFITLSIVIILQIETHL